MSSSIYGSAFPDEVDPRVEGFTAMIQRYLSHNKSGNQKKDHCDDCVWTVSRLETLQKMTAEYARMRKTDDDMIDWNTLILELVTKDDQNISSPPKKARLELPAVDPLMQEQESKAAESAAFWEDDRIECDFDDQSEEQSDEQSEQNDDEEEEDNRMDQEEDEQENHDDEQASIDMKTE